MTISLPTAAPHRTRIDAFACPFCGRRVAAHDRLSYPPEVAALYTPVYRCSRCHRHMGLPINVAVVRGGVVEYEEH